MHFIERAPDGILLWVTKPWVKIALLVFSNGIICDIISYKTKVLIMSGPYTILKHLYKACEVWTTLFSQVYIIKHIQNIQRQSPMSIKRHNPGTNAPSEYGHSRRISNNCLAAIWPKIQLFSNQIQLFSNKSNYFQIKSNYFQIKCNHIEKTNIWRKYELKYI